MKLSEILFYSTMGFAWLLLVGLLVFAIREFWHDKGVASIFGIVLLFWLTASAAIALAVMGL